ncbi:MAG: 50S ribosomal protein L3 [Thiotrichales bacterium]|nr:50S ribosomal protein L3 [Thiotrichales bacterium]MBT3613756.1 50S ribosomal protein L3 [Thiotrichales bacterium]MBT3752479.1 50S ribosomal protein L3 [Thiotrichales bacterium]MBT3838115.1 50S ribosomal protein L3 [Thiotrichales bacterium]MBT4152648.1 50S ribosomal protein L3 [Thiotrichales bacterium]
MGCGIVGRKVGMSRVFTEEGTSIPVTVVHVEPNRITQIKSNEIDGYSAIQVTTGTRRASRVTKSMAGHYAKAGVEAGRGLWEFRLTTEQTAEFEAGKDIEVSIFEEGQKVDVTGVNRGFGFQGGIKRHHFAGLDATHGNSISHRSNGSIGQCQTPGRVFKGKKMSGHMGNVQRTAQNLEVVRVDSERNLILIKGAVPGAKGGDLIINHAIKFAGKAK